MTARRLAVALGIIGGTAWAAKFLIMLAQGGPESESIPENVTFFLGLLALAVGAAAAGWHLARGRSTGLHLLAAVGGVLVLVVLLGTGQTLFTALPGESWQQEEAIFALLGVLAALTALAARLRPRVPHRSRPV